MSKTNPVVLNGASIAGATGVTLNDGDEVVFPSAESERIVFKYQLVAKETGAVLGTVKSVGDAEATNAAPKSPLGERNGEGMVAKSPAKKAPTPAKKAPTPAKSPKSAARAASLSGRTTRDLMIEMSGRRLRSFSTSLGLIEP